MQLRELQETYTLFRYKEKEKKKQTNKELNRRGEKITFSTPVYTLNIKYQEAFESCGTLATTGQSSSRLD